jgi:2-polyprenyl-3-methyl-5-hydroxy-6-metoxy-1,4-benzoquinol methylase
MASCWAERCKELSSVDVCDQRVTSEGYKFFLIQDEGLPFDDGQFDVVISNQVLEHVWDQKRHIREIARVLKADGVAYLSTPNRFCLMEPHHRLPLLAWFGDRVARTYLKCASGKDWDVKLLSYRKLLRMLSGYFVAIDAIPQVMSKPLRYHQTGNERLARCFSLIPSFLWRASFNPLLPSFMIVLKKRGRKPIESRRGEA